MHKRSYIMASVDKEAIKQLKSKVRGEVLLPSDPGYDEARTIWNAMIDRRPGVIVRCAGAQDVVQAVRSGRQHGLTLAVGGGGDDIAGDAGCEGGVVVDLTPVKSLWGGG